MLLHPRQTRLERASAGLHLAVLDGKYLSRDTQEGSRVARRCDLLRREHPWQPTRVSQGRLLHPTATAVIVRAPERASTGEEQGGLFPDAAEAEPVTTANLSEPARVYLAALGIADPDADEESAGLVWNHVLAIGYAPAYLDEHADAIRGDWPRVPLPDSEAALRASAAFGRQLGELLDTERSYAQSAVVRRLSASLNSVGAFHTIPGAAFDEAAGGLDV